MNKVDKKAIGALLTGLLVIAFAGCQPKEELEEAGTTTSSEESTEVEMTEDLKPTTGKKTQDEAEMLDPTGYSEVEPINPNLVIGEEEDED